MVVVFDLDDTLYNENSFVESGFLAVSIYLNGGYSLPINETFSFMVQRLVNGRGRIFDDCLQKYSIFTKAEVQRCISIYRHHNPNISLWPEADECLNRLSMLPSYIVTDGNKLVQYNKVRNLSLYKRVKYCFITHRYGLIHSKPSPYCFLEICKREKVDSKDVVYIGDDPNKDFVEIKKLGFKTIRVLTGKYKAIKKTAEYEANCNINTLSELDMNLLKQLFD